MIGLSDELEEVKRILTGNWRDEIISYALVGTAGVGKTALFREVCHDPQVQSFFDCRVWIKVGREHYDFVNLAAQHRACCQNCLIVLDDVWDDSGLLNFTRSAMGQKFHGSFRLLITARGPNAIKRAHDCVSGSLHKVLRFLTEDESKDLLCREVFGEGEACPTHLDKAVMKIAKNCEGLPLMILVVARQQRLGLLD